MKKYIPTILWALTFTAAAVRCFTAAREQVEFDIFFDGWWTLFILVPAVVDILCRGFRSANLTCLLAGGLLFLAMQDFAAWDTLGKFMLPLILLIAGFGIIFSGFSAARSNAESDNCITVTAAFSRTLHTAEKEKTVASVIATSVFGKAVLDLSDAVFTENTTVSVNAVLGEVEIVLPENATAKAEGLRVLSGCKNDTLGRDGIQITVDYNCVLGSVTVK